ncbi:shikimate kinase [Neobacillus niacini]|uniref:shikimate kinase n=1 Tax=Neobacillus niacini TaxID=86668 RepID=UPI0037C6087C
MVHSGKSIVFIGFMGAGKTTVGKLVAQKLNRKFIDTDEVIEKELNMPIPLVFKKYGEKVFREKEKSVITDLSEKTNLVLSLGGGAFLQEEIRSACLSNSIVIFLDISFESWKERLDLIIDNRPVLQGKSIDETLQLYQNRQEVYTNHHIKIKVDYKNPEEIADEILATL